MKRQTCAIVLAAGQGKRMGTRIQKQFLDLGGYPVLFYSLNAFEKSQVDQVILVTGKQEMEFCRQDLVERYGFSKVKAVVAGGAERYHSVCEGLKQVPDSSAIVLIHDGARPFVDSEIIDRTIEAAEQFGACAAGMPSKDTVKIADENGFAASTPDRSRVWMVQTHGTSMYGKPPSSYAGNGWLEGSKEVFTAIDTALIDGANIAGFGFKNGVMASLDGQTTDSFNPENSKLILDGKRGRATILEGVFKRLYFEDCFTKNRFLNLRGVHLNEYDPEESYRIGDCYYSGSSIYTHQSDGDTKLDYGYVYTGYFSYIVNPAYSRMIQAGCAEAGKMNVIYMPDVSEDNYGTEVVICVPSRIGTRSVTGEEGRCVVSQRNIINVDERTLLIGDDTKGGDVTLVSTPMGWLVKTLHHVGCDNARVMRLLFGGGSSSYSVSIDSACININTSKISVKRNGVGDVTVTIRSGTAGFFYGSHVNVTGYGNVLGSSESPVKATIGDISYSSLSYDFIVRVLLSDDSSRNDGSFFMDVYSSKSIYIGKTSE